jgi:hypothetical protein
MCPFGLELRFPLKKLRFVKYKSSDGDLHYVMIEPARTDTIQLEEPLDEKEAKKITKRDASSLLFLTREE